MMKTFFLLIAWGLLCANIYGLKAQNSKARLTHKKPIVEMVFVQGGEFVMGKGDSSIDYYGSKPYKTIVNSFYISKYEITFEQFARVYNWGIKHKSLDFAYVGGATEKSSRVGLYDWFGMGVVRDQNERDGIVLEKGFEKLPCTSVSFNGAAVFCNQLSKMEGLDTCYVFTELDFTYWLKSGRNGYRLPTEKEWEFAARGGIKSKGYVYSGSNRAEKVAWFDKNSHGEAHKVGLKKANELGLYDMSGNVWEWCDSGFGQYPILSRTWGFVLRGGSFKSVKDDLRVTRRRGTYCNLFSERVGFRIVRSTPEAIKKEKNKRSRRRGRRRR